MIRWLAIVAGCFAAGAGFLAFGLVFLVVPSILVLGAIIQPYANRLGKWLMGAGAFVLSVFAGLFLAPQAVGMIWRLPLYHTFHDVALASLFSVSLALVGWCDASLVIDARERNK